MNISSYFIRNPIQAILLFVLLSLAGIFGFSQMSAKLFPDIDLPVIVITVPVPGASPQQLENEVARKIEDKIASLSGLKHIHTTLVDNAATITAEFIIEKPLQEALDDVRSAVDEVRGDFPVAAEDPIFTKFNLNEQPLFIYSIASSHLEPVDLSWFVDNDLNKALLGIRGVAAITRIGGVEREVQVLTDPVAMRAYQLSMGDISQQIHSMQQNFSGGETNFGGLKQPIRTIAAVQNVEDLQSLRIALPDNRIVRLADFSTIQDTFKEQTSKALLGGKEGVAFIVQRSKGFGDIDVGEKVRTTLDGIRKKHSHLTITEVFETVSMVEQDYDGALMMLMEGAALAVFVVLLFLGGWRPTFFFAIALGVAYLLVNTRDESWAVYAAIAVVAITVIVFFNDFRTTIVASIALPLSMLPAFAGMYFLDISMNMMVTLALSLVIGILVDDAIVEVENIDRHINMGKTPYQASIEATDEIGLAVIAITMTLIAVFLPTAFMGGISGKFFYQFGVAASLSIFSSLLVARIITPMMCAYFLTPHQRTIPEPFWMKFYLAIVHLAIRFRWVTLTISLVFFGVSLMAMASLPKGFIPVNDSSFTKIHIELPPGGKLDKTIEVAENVRKSIEDIAAIKTIFSYVGGREVRQATIYLTFVKRGERPKKPDIENDIRQRLEDIPGARFSVASGGNGEVYEMILSGHNSLELANASQAIISELRTIDGLGTISNSAGLTRQELVIYPDFITAAERGVNSAAIAQAIRVATVGDFEGLLAKFNSGERQIPIVVRLSDSNKADINVLNDLLVIGRKGPVRIGDVARLTLSDGPLEIKRYDRERFVKLEIEIKSGELGEIQRAINALPSVKNLPQTVTQIAAGDTEGMAELAVSFAIAMGVAILCIYFVLILLFGQLSQPITILVALPLSIGGAVVGLKLVGAGLSLSAMIGFLMLMGIAVKNSILLVEYTIERRKENPEMNRLDAIMDACHKRARPIVMTTIAMGAGMLPLIIGLGSADPSFRRPMAAAVLGGLITSTLLSLIVIPAFYSIIDDGSRRAGRSVQLTARLATKLKALPKRKDSMS